MLCFGLFYLIAFFNSNSAVFAQIGSIEKHYFVSPEGDDANPGTIDKPFKTIAKAQEAIRQINKSMNGDVYINLREGTYYIDTSLIYRPEDSGYNGFVVKYKNYQDEYVIISGGKKIKDWEVYEDKWRAYVGKNINFRQFYVNGSRATRAISSGGLPGAVKTDFGYTTLNEEMVSWGNIQDIEIVSNREWRQYRCGIESVSGKNITIKEPCFSNTQAHQGMEMELPTWIENAYELLDEPGEWYFDRITGWIYYIPLPDEKITTLDAVIPLVETLITVDGEPTNPVRNLVFEGIVFAHSTWLRPSSNDGFAEVNANFTLTGRIHNDLYDGIFPYGNWTKPHANLQFRSAHNVNLINNVFIHLGGAGVSFDKGSQNNLIQGNHFSDISGSAILMGDVDKVDVNTDPVEITKDNTISNNLIYTISQEYAGGVAIWVGYTQGVKILHNEIFGLPYSGISLGWWVAFDPTLAKDNIVENNRIHNHVNYLNDGGGIYTLSSQPGSRIIGNLITNQGNEYGALYLDNRSRHLYVENNVVYDNKRTALIKGGDHTIVNNYWQNRYPEDIKFVTWDNENCRPTPCGQSIVEGNQEIVSLNEVSDSIIQKAGLEDLYSSVYRPELLSPNDEVKPGLYLFNWSEIPGKKYKLFIDDLTNGWSDNCADLLEFDVCLTLDDNRFLFELKKGREYKWWVQTVVDTNFVTDPVYENIKVISSPEGDVNGDGKVDGIDFIIWLNHFGQNIGGAENGDFNDDEVVDTEDYNIWVDNFSYP